jgi:pimeloyl-ACP methyl ester carboxylesterase
MVSLARRPSVRRLALWDIMRHGELVSPADAVDLARSALRCTIAQLALSALRADRDLALRDLDRIDCPVLLASPQFDRVLPPERHAPRLRREIPGAQSRVLAGCGHVPMWDDTRLVVRMICEWVDGDAGGAGLGPAYAAASLPLG